MNTPYFVAQAGDTSTLPGTIRYRMDTRLHFLKVPHRYSGEWRDKDYVLKVIRDVKMTRPGKLVAADMNY